MSADENNRPFSELIQLPTMAEQAEENERDAASSINEHADSNIPDGSSVRTEREDQSTGDKGSNSEMNQAPTESVNGETEEETNRERAPSLNMDGGPGEAFRGEESVDIDITERSRFPESVLSPTERRDSAITIPSTQDNDSVMEATHVYGDRLEPDNRSQGREGSTHSFHSDSPDWGAASENGYHSNITRSATPSDKGSMDGHLATGNGYPTEGHASNPTPAEESTFTSVNMENEEDKDTVYMRDGVRKIDYVLVYEKAEAKKKKREIFQQNLKKEGLQLETEERETLCFVKIHAPWETLCRMAEIINLKMPIEEKHVHGEDVAGTEEYENEEFKQDTCCDCSCRCRHPMAVDPNLVTPEKHTFTADFRVHNLKMFVIEDKDTFFSNAQRSMCVYELLLRTRYDHYYPTLFGIDRLIRDGVFKTAYPLHDGDYKLKTKSKKAIPSNDRLILYRTWARFGSWCSFQPLDMIRRYFGEKIGIYFAWLGYYTYMLILPTIVGIGVFVYGLVTVSDNVPSEEICNFNQAGQIWMCPQCYKNCPYWRLKDSCLFSRVTYVFDNMATALFAIFMALWGTIFLEFWKRKEASLQYDWDVAHFELEERVRPDFEAKVQRRKMNPVTKMLEPTMPPSSKCCRQMSSVFVVLLMICLVVAAVFGVVVYRTIIVAILFSIGQGEIKTLAKLITSFTAACVNLLFILIMNKVYRKIANFLTEYERCKTTSEYEDSYTFKVYLFEFVNFYSTIIYIAFFKGQFSGRPGSNDSLFFGKWRHDECDPSGCLIELCMQLGVVMIGRQTVNNCQEIILPRLIVIFKTWQVKKGAKHQKLDTRMEKDFVLEQAPELALFEEYLEMVIQYGFVTIFVAAFPLAPLIALVNNILEIRIDANKFTTQYQRMPPHRAQNIGIWFPILQGVTFLSVLTNALIIGWTSDFVPKMVYRFKYGGGGWSLHGYINHSLSYFNVSDFTALQRPDVVNVGFKNNELCRYSDFRNPPWDPNRYDYSQHYWHVLAGRLAFIIVFEHVVAFCTWLLAVLIPDIPGRVKLLMLREMRLNKDNRYQTTYADDAFVVAGGAKKRSSTVKEFKTA